MYHDMLQVKQVKKATCHSLYLLGSTFTGYLAPLTFLGKMSDVLLGRPSVCPSVSTSFVFASVSFPMEGIFFIYCLWCVDYNEGFGSPI